MNDITFNGIKESLIEYYKTKSEFKDFNWAAPAISTLIDAQAYLAYWMTTYAGFALNEVFLDTAQKRSSVVSKAKNIGYFPKQYTSSKAKIRMDYTGTVNLDTFIMPIGTTFTAIKDDVTYNFRTYTPHTVYGTQTGKYWCEVNVREGTVVTQKWTQNETKSQRFILSHPKVDTSTIKVYVYTNSADTVGTEYTLLSNISQFGPKSTLYSVEENTEGFVELKFGDDVLSKSIQTGNIVKCEFLATSGIVANNISVFELSSIPNTPSNVQRWTLSTLEVSHDGSDRESIELIRSNAPKFFQRQGRNVIAEDYKTDILANYGDYIDSISVWGGENNTPPEYGSVFISLKPKNATALTSKQKDDIITTITKNSVVGITPKIIDPNIIYVNIGVYVEYSQLYSNKNTVTIKDEITNAILLFFNNSASSFNIDFKYSKFLSTLFNVDSTISDIETNISLYQYFKPVINTKSTYIIDFKNEIKEGSVYVGPFSTLGINPGMYYMEDDGNGILYEKHTENGEIISIEVGTVNYEYGKVYINKYTFNTEHGVQVPITISPANNNMKVSENYILSIDSVTVNVNDKKEDK